MKIFVAATPGSRTARIQEIDPTHYRIAVREKAVDGKANEAIIRALAEHLGIAKSRIALLRGEAGRNKIFEAAV